MAPVELSSSLHAGTVFNLTCAVLVGEAVDTELQITTVWYQRRALLSSTDRVAVASEATLNRNSGGYLSQVVFSPLSSQQGGGDGGNYTCSADIQNEDYITGSNASNSQDITVIGQLCHVTHMLYY